MRGSYLDDFAALLGLHSVSQKDKIMKQPPVLVSMPMIALGISLLAGFAQAQPRPLGGPPFRKEAFPDFGLKKNGPKIGDKALDFELRFLDSKETFKLSNNFDKRPTVLIFHSFT